MFGMIGNWVTRSKAEFLSVDHMIGIGRRWWKTSSHVIISHLKDVITGLHNVRCRNAEHLEELHWGAWDGGHKLRKSLKTHQILEQHSRQASSPRHCEPWQGWPKQRLRVHPGNVSVFILWLNFEMINLWIVILHSDNSSPADSSMASNSFPVERLHREWIHNSNLSGNVWGFWHFSHWQSGTAKLQGCTTNQK